MILFHAKAMESFLRQKANIMFFFFYGVCNVASQRNRFGQLFYSSYETAWYYIQLATEANVHKIEFYFKFQICITYRMIDISRCESLRNQQDFNVSMTTEKIIHCRYILGPNMTQTCH